MIDYQGEQLYQESIVYTEDKKFSNVPKDIVEFKGIAGKFTLRNKACYFLTKYSQIETKERIFMLQIFNYTAGKGDCIRLHYTGKSGVIRNVINDLL